MNVVIRKWSLTDEELIVLHAEVKKFYSPVVRYKDKWKRFDTVYIATNNQNLFTEIYTG